MSRARQKALSPTVLEQDLSRLFFGRDQSPIRRNLSRKVINSNHLRPGPLQLNNGIDCQRIHDRYAASKVQNPNEDTSSWTDQLNADYVLFLIDMIFCVLIVVGLSVLLVLACTVGVPYFPIISALSTKEISTCALSASASVATGAVGLALSSFFKLTIEMFKGPTHNAEAGLSI